MLQEQDRLMVNQMLQACKNILSATSDISRPDDFEEDQFVFENIFMNLTIMVESYVKISPELKDNFGFINWQEIKKYTSILNMDSQNVDNNQLLFACRNKIPMMKSELEKILSGNGQ